ncbi:hypothetical protein X801_09991 [Opisthorchis viverrini]|uniref:SNF2 N-terminal domain-containing protein n=1 Tax=Opisthorchis viverrini TaxID=6198 RepID=A0A1S8WIZ1_OPIVI|nr:hypothetical protein X801_09991 [Opisthorchis viverrini]
MVSCPAKVGEGFVCLDEAQMVERVTSKTARMMSRIDAVHRWCITGTPAEKSIDGELRTYAYTTQP